MRRRPGWAGRRSTRIQLIIFKVSLREPGKLRESLACDVWASGRGRREHDMSFDYHRYRQLLADAVDDDKRLALINLLIEERAKDRLAAQNATDHAAMTASTIAQVLRSSRT